MNSLKLGLSRALAAFILSAALAASSQAATCSVSISNISPIPNIVYDPFEGLARSVTYMVEFLNAGPDICSVGLAIASPAPGPRAFKNGANQLRYTLEWPGGAIFTNNTSAPIGTISIPANGARRTVTLRVKVDAGLIAPAAAYTDTLTFRAYRAAAGPLVQVGTDRTTTAGATLEARAQVNIAGASGTFGTPFALDHIDFGTLAAGAARNAIVQVRATSPVSIL